MPNLFLRKRSVFRIRIKRVFHKEKSLKEFATFFDGDGKLIKPVDYVDDAIGLKITYGATTKDQVVIETTVLVEGYGSFTCWFPTFGL